MLWHSPPRYFNNMLACSFLNLCVLYLTKQLINLCVDSNHGHWKQKSETNPCMSLHQTNGAQKMWLFFWAAYGQLIYRPAILYATKRSQNLFQHAHLFTPDIHNDSVRVIMLTRAVKRFRIALICCMCCDITRLGVCKATVHLTRKKAKQTAPAGSTLKSWGPRSSSIPISIGITPRGRMYAYCV